MASESPGVIYSGWLGQTHEWHGWQSPEPGWLSIREAAAMLGISRQRVHVLVDGGRLKAKKHGGRLLVEAARLLGCTRSQLYELVKAGRIRA